jgi:hypothetical protein
MAKTKISEFSATPSSNTDIDGINIAEGCAPSGINNAIRELMAQLKDFQTGAAGDSFNGPVGTSTAAAGAFTNLSASGTLGVTGVATLGNGAILGTPASVTLTNATGLPIATGVSGLGTGVATALAVNVGSAGAPVVNGGALGTPSSGTVTNLTGTASININGTVGATTASTGAFTTLTTSSTVTHNAGTANGVAYLNGSKVLTTGSALTFDGGNFTANGLRLNGADVTNTIYQATGALGISTGSASGIVFSTNFTQRYTIDGTGVSAWSVGGSEQMRLTSTGLGIGTSSPASKLHVNAASGSVFAQISSGSNDLYLGYDGVSGMQTMQSDTGIYFSTGASFTERMRLDSSGNLGLGVTPSAWNLSGMQAVQVKSASLAGYADSAYYSANAYFGGGAWRYINSVAAFQYNLDGAHKWYTAPSGTAGNAISFTQAMTLDASGNLVVGNTSALGKLDIGLSGTARRLLVTYDDSLVTVKSAGSSANPEVLRMIGDDIRFNTGTSGSGSERARIDSSGNFSLTKLALNIDSPFITGANISSGANPVALGTTGSANIHFFTANSERARINSSGALLVGQTSWAFANNGTQIAANGRIFNTSNTDYNMEFAGSTSARLRFYSNAGGSGTTVGGITVDATNTQYNTSSDYRLKNITGPITTSGAYIDSLNPVEGTWKIDGSTFVGLLAHEAQEVSRTKVATGVKDGEEMQGMDYSSAEIIANLIAEVKSLRARLAAANI